MLKGKKKKKKKKKMRQRKWPLKEKDKQLCSGIYRGIFL
jgi:hypothetical protein